MDNEIQATIDKIKMQEQEKENKLKEKRAIETKLANQKRSLNEIILLTAKLKKELVDTTNRTDSVQAQVTTAQALQSSLVAQLDASGKELKQLKITSEQGISKVWEMRNSLCEEVHQVSDQCDVWALFTKPKFIELPKVIRLPNDNTNQANELRVLVKVHNKREALIAERNRLMNEPDSGEEFKRYLA